MMVFYSAAGSYKIRDEEKGKRPYIQRLGKLNPISIPEFVIWTSLLWQVRTYDELREAYEQQMRSAPYPAPNLDDMLKMLIRRKLIVKGEGYTGVDALYSMMSDAFVVPTMEAPLCKLKRCVSLLFRGKITIYDFKRLIQREPMTKDEKYVMSLVKQTPLSVAELIQCFNRKITDVSTDEKVITGIYPEEDSCQATIANQMYPHPNAKRILKAAANLYLRRAVLLEKI